MRDLFGNERPHPSKTRLTYHLRTSETGAVQAWTERGELIGTEDQALWLSGLGIVPELALPTSRVCSVGFCAARQQWGGWKGRLRAAFGIGSVAVWGRAETLQTATPEQIARDPSLDVSVPVGFVARTLDDARRMAVAFAVASGAR